MNSNFQYCRCMIFMFCVALTFITILFYNYSDELTVKVMKPYIERKIQNMDLARLKNMIESQGIEIPNEVVANPKAAMSGVKEILHNKETASFFKKLIMENMKAFKEVAKWQKNQTQYNNSGNVNPPQINHMTPQGPQFNMLASLINSQKGQPKILNTLQNLKNLEKTSNSVFDTNESKSNSSTLSNNLEPFNAFEMTTLNATNSDLLKLMNITNFKYSPFHGKVSDLYDPGFLYLPVHICPHRGETLKFFIIVTSAPENFESRNAIRETWGNFSTESDYGLAFLVGASTPIIESKIDEENFLHDDIIRAKFIDSYSNLTLKTVSMLEFVDYKCPKAKFILKADDDTFINVKKLSKIISERFNDTKSIYGRVGRNWVPFRDPRSKYFLTYEEFSGKVFPDLVSGPAYMMTNDCIEILYDKTLKQKYLKLEDVLVTGIVAQQNGIKRVHLKEFENEEMQVLNPCKLASDVSVHYVKPEQQYIFWESLNDKNVVC